MVYGVIDCNSFFASCEISFRPWLSGAPVAVISGDDKHGCVLARSREAKKTGLPMGAPVFKHMDLIEREGIKLFTENPVSYTHLTLPTIA